jgi:hypothetical protein
VAVAASPLEPGEREGAKNGDGLPLQSDLR